MKKQAKVLTILYWISIFAFFLFFGITSALALYERQFQGKIYPGITVESIPLGAKTRDDALNIFEAKNAAFREAQFAFAYEGKIATVSASDIGLGYNSRLIADQAFTIGRTGNLFADLFNKGKAWFGDLTLPASYAIDRQALEKALSPFTKGIAIAPVDGVFELKNGRVVAFQPSQEGKGIDFATMEERVLASIPEIRSGKALYFESALPVTTIRPKLALEDTNDLGIKEHIGQGRSLFRGSIANRVHNIVLAATRIDGTIVAAGETFSFNEAVGDVSKLTGYKEAYIIKDGKTILGDGGGVCQVSTTLFRAMLASGLPIIERHPHSYRVAYYEQDSPPGLDATVYAPSYDLKLKNDTGAAILIEAYADTANSSLVFDLYGTSDGRKVSLSKSTITNQVPAPEDLYQDDPTLSIGVVKQIDFKATGATVIFSRTVEKDGNVLAAESFKSTYRPWQAVFLRGTREITQ